MSHYTVDEHMSLVVVTDRRAQWRRRWAMYWLGVDERRSYGPAGRLDRRTRTVHGRRAQDAVPERLWRGVAWALVIEVLVVIVVVATQVLA